MTRKRQTARLRKKSCGLIIQPMFTWIDFAAIVRAGMDRLANGTAERRFQIIRDSYKTAVTKHAYPGTLAGWEGMIDHSSGWPANSSVKSWVSAAFQT